MSGDDAQHPVANQEIGIDRAARLVARNAQIDCSRAEYRKPRQNCVAETPEPLAKAYAGDDATPGDLAKVSPLIVMPVAPAAGGDLLQAGNVSIDLAQHGGDAAGVVAPIDADAGMYVVGRNPDRRPLLNNRSSGQAPGTTDGPVRPPSHGHLKIFKHLNLRGLVPSYPLLARRGDGEG